jgi:hypothetical protein
MLDAQNQGPQCTACGSPMKLTAIEPSTAGQDLRTFTCQHCKRVQRWVFPSPTSASGHLEEEKLTAAEPKLFAHCYQEALSIIEENRSVVVALAQALIDHPDRTPNATEIDAVIVPALAAKAAADKIEHRARRRQVEQNAAYFAAGLSSATSAGS